tara:strand:+ start:15076 stop:16764 length:1689 start_codon:yes stop_codon:yes gene_type:complete
MIPQNKTNEEQLDELDNCLLSDKELKKIMNIKIEFDSNLKELNFLTNYEGNENNTILNDINLTNTIFGKNILQKQIVNYKYDKKKIDKIKKIIKFIKKNKIKINFKQLNDNTNNVLWFFKKIDENFKSILEQLYFNLPIEKLNNILNSHKVPLNISSIYNIYIYPITNILGPIISIIVPYILLRVYGLQIPFTFFYEMIKKYITGLKDPKRLFSTILYIGIYLYSVYKNFRQAYDLKKLINIFQNKIICLDKFTSEVVNIYETFKDFYQIEGIDELLNELKNIPKEMKTFMLTGNILYFINKYRNYDKFVEMFNIVGEIDLIYNIKKLTDKDYCFVKFTKKTKPVIIFKKMAHPSLTDPIYNNVKIVGKNCMITGPNAAGKSTFIKGLVSNIILAQTFGISRCSYAKITPFDYIKTHLNTPDVINEQSLFEAEMYKCKEIISSIKNNKNKSLIILDELFSSTNYREGYAASAAIMKKINDYSNTCTIITTHYEKLPYYAKKLGFKNFMFPIKRNKTNGLLFPYKIKKGISQDFVALEILKMNDYDSDIINNAIKISKSFNFS